MYRITIRRVLYLYILLRCLLYISFSKEQETPAQRIGVSNDKKPAAASTATTATTEDVKLPLNASCLPQIHP